MKMKMKVINKVRRIFTTFENEVQHYILMLEWLIQGGPKKGATLKRDHFKTINPF